MNGIFDLIMLVLRIAIALAVFGFVVVLLRRSLKSIRQQERWVIERFGKYNRILGPGLHWVTPFIERVRAVVSIWEQPLLLFEEKPWLDFKEGGEAQLVDPDIWVRPLGVADNDENTIRSSVRKMVYLVVNWRDGTIDNSETCIQRYLNSITVEEAMGTVQDRKPWWEIVKAAFPDLEKKLAEWGLEVTRITIADFQWSKEVEDTRRKVYEAQREVARMEHAIKSAEKDATRQANVIGGVISQINELLIKHGYSKQKAQGLAPRIFAFVKAAETRSLFLTRIGGEEGIGPIFAEVAAVMERARETVTGKEESEKNEKERKPGKRA